MDKHEAILLLVISIGAFVIPFISRRLYLPSAVGEIFYGLVLGIFFKDIIHETPIVKLLGELGFIILMYLAGLEINFDRIRSTSKRDLTVYFISLFMIVFLSFYITFSFEFPLIYALVFLTIAIGLLYPVLKDTGLLKTNFAQSVLIIGSIGEIISLLFITGFTLYYQFGLSTKALIHLIEIYIFFAIAYFIIKIFQLYIWWNPKLTSTFLKTGDPTETGIRANFVNMFIFVALASLLSMEPIIGAFMGGMLFALVFKERREIQEKFSAFGYGFLIPIFFIEVGLQFDIFQLIKPEIILSALILTAVIFFIRSVAAMIFVFSGFSWKEIFLIPFSLSMPLTLLVAIATIGLEVNMLDKKQASIIILSAILSGLIYPWLFKIIVKKIKIEESKETDKINKT
ncbi:cation:proton antiporter [Persephonella sp.]